MWTRVASFLFVPLVIAVIASFVLRVVYWWLDKFVYVVLVKGVLEQQSFLPNIAPLVIFLILVAVKLFICKFL